MNWIEIKLTTTPQASEAAIGIMYNMGIKGLSIEDPRDILENNKSPNQWDYIDDKLKKSDLNKIVIRAYLSQHENYVEKIELFKEKFKNVSKYFDIGDGKIELSDICEEDWANNWKKFFDITRIGNNVVIQPTWKEFKHDNKNDVVIKMDPGMAFGSGTHETTRMCLQLVEKYVRKYMNILDVGCGSGILGIGALKFGASRCISVDIDKNAVKTAQQNAQLNGVLDNIDVRNGDLLDVVSGKFDVVFANIIADAIISLSEIVQPYLKQNGIFIASGIIKDRYEEVKTVLIEHGFKIKDELFMGEWVAVSATM